MLTSTMARRRRRWQKYCTDDLGMQPFRTVRLLPTTADEESPLVQAEKTIIEACRRCSDTPLSIIIQERAATRGAAPLHTMEISATIRSSRACESLCLCLGLSLLHLLANHLEGDGGCKENGRASAEYDTENHGEGETAYGITTKEEDAEEHEQGGE